MNSGNRPVKKFSEIYENILDSEGSLSELINEEFLIHDVEFKKSKIGEVAIVTVEYDNQIRKLHTFSGVLLDQLREIKKHTDKGFSIQVKLVKRKNYYTFT